jgi:hypothetical protein
LFAPFILIYDLLFLPINLVWTVLLLLVIFYWLGVIFGLTDTEFLDVELDADADLSFLDTFLHYFNIGEVPFIIIASIGILSGWSISILSNYYLSDGTFFRGLIFIIPNLIITGFVVKVSLKPFVKLFKTLNHDTNALQNVVGKICIIHSSNATQSFGQAEVIHESASILVNVRTQENEIISKGEKAFISSQEKSGDFYIVSKISELNDKGE